jgi:hypothetical protein
VCVFVVVVVRSGGGDGDGGGGFEVVMGCEGEGGRGNKA